MATSSAVSSCSWIPPSAAAAAAVGSRSSWRRSRFVGPIKRRSGSIGIERKIACCCTAPSRNAQTLNSNVRFQLFFYFLEFCWILIDIFSLYLNCEFESCRCCAGIRIWIGNAINFAFFIIKLVQTRTIIFSTHNLCLNYIKKEI